MTPSPHPDLRSQLRAAEDRGDRWKAACGKRKAEVERLQAWIEDGKRNGHVCRRLECDDFTGEDGEMRLCMDCVDREEREDG